MSTAPLHVGIREMPLSPLFSPCNGDANAHSLIHAIAQQRVGDLNGLAPRIRVQVLHRGRVTILGPGHDHNSANSRRDKSINLMMTFSWCRLLMLVNIWHSI
jgi:hypothetical protein